MKTLRQKFEKANIFLKKGNDFLNQKKYIKAIDCSNQAISMNPKNYDADSNKGFALFQLEKYQKAINCFDKVIMLILLENLH